VGGRGRWHGHEERDVILGLVDETVKAGARQSKVCEALGLSARALQRWRDQGVGADGRAGPRTVPRNKLSALEESRVLDLVNQPEFRDLSPKQIVPILAERGIFIASESTIYRILRKAKQARRRETTRPPTKRHAPKELKAVAPNQVWSWDITWMPTPVRGLYFRAYIVLDVWSRKIVAAEVFEHESAEHASILITQACEQFDITAGRLALHSDNGAPMKASTMLATLQSLGVACSFSRPGVSNDNPFSESAFRTMKYRPNYPEKPFETLENARSWIREFVRWYNFEHRHSSIGFVTPDERHARRDEAILERRRNTYNKAKRRHPERWSADARPWLSPEVVTLNPAANRQEQRVSA
jgi:putative transposase